MVSETRIVQWMNVIRNSSGETQKRILESFWESQLKSKSWIVRELKKLKLLDDGNVYIFGGWYGVLASLILDNFLYKNVYSVDIDLNCTVIGSQMDNRIHFITDDMASFNEYYSAGLVVNTSTEHISQDIFDKWLKNAPNKVPIVLQGNNFFSCEEHVRCHNTLDEFIKNNKLSKIVYSGVLDCKDFNRYMIIGYK
jgi:hypothetical protein